MDPSWMGQVCFWPDYDHGNSWGTEMDDNAFQGAWYVMRVVVLWWLHLLLVEWVVVRPTDWAIYYGSHCSNNKYLSKSANLRSDCPCCMVWKFSVYLQSTPCSREQHVQPRLEQLSFWLENNKVPGESYILLSCMGDMSPEVNFVETWLICVAEQTQLFDLGLGLQQSPTRRRHGLNLDSDAGNKYNDLLPAHQSSKVTRILFLVLSTTFTLSGSLHNKSLSNLPWLVDYPVNLLQIYHSHDKWWFTCLDVTYSL